MRQSLPSNRMKRSWRNCAAALLCAGSSGCVPTPVQVTCQYPAPPEVLMVPPPPPASFTDRLNSILSPYLTSPAKPTN